MNGVMPGPLWLAIVSSVNGTPNENRTLTQASGKATLLKMTDSKERLTDRRRTGHAHREDAPGSQIHERKRHGG